MLPVTPPSWCCPQDNTARVQEDLEGEFQSLYVLLDELKDGMVTKIKQERASRTYELQVSPRVSPPPNTHTQRGGLPVTPLPPCPPQTQLAACAKALESSEELLETANQTLQTANNHDFIEVSPSAPTGAGLCPHPAVPGGGGRGCPVSPPPTTTSACAFGHVFLLFLRWALR